MIREKAAGFSPVVRAIGFCMKKTRPVENISGTRDISHKKDNRKKLCRRCLCGGIVINIGLAGVHRVVSHAYDWPPILPGGQIFIFVHIGGTPFLAFIGAKNGQTVPARLVPYSVCGGGR